MYAMEEPVREQSLRARNRGVSRGAGGQGAGAGVEVKGKAAGVLMPSGLQPGALWTRYL